MIVGAVTADFNTCKVIADKLAGMMRYRRSGKFKLFRKLISVHRLMLCERENPKTCRVADGL